jgi:hypothetical protein
MKTRSTFARWDARCCPLKTSSDGFEELDADEMDVAGFLLTFYASLNRRHPRRDQS